MRDLKFDETKSTRARVEVNQWRRENTISSLEAVSLVEKWGK